MASGYIWTLENGTLPPGTSLTLSETDLDIALVGTPTEAGVFNFTVRITNDISGAFDEQSYEVSITELLLQISPDLGTTWGAIFDAANPKLVSIKAADMMDLGSLLPFRHNQTLDKLRLNLDIGDGERSYLLPVSALRKLNSGRKYLYRLSASPDDVRTIRIV